VVQTRLRGVPDLLLEVLSPPRCVACGLYAHWLCRQCRLKLGEWPRLTCPGCFNRSPHGLTCQDCLKLGGPLLQLVSCFEYESRAFHALLARFKEGGVRAVAEILADRMVAAMRLHIPTTGYLVPVPGKPDRVARRGFDQTLLLAQVVSRRCNLPILTNLVKRRSSQKKAQKELSLYQRRSSIANEFYLEPQSVQLLKKTDSIILVDDVATTLATLDTIGTLLLNADQRVWALVLAHAAR
jgi:competence protein ComFC